MHAVNTKVLWVLFYVSNETAGITFSHPVNTHTYIYIYRFTCVRRKRYIEQRLETQREDKRISCRKSDHCFVSATKVEIVWDREEKLQHNCFV
jgi:hypothetical protein